MKTICKTVGPQTYFIIPDLDPAYHDTMRKLRFSQVEDGFAKTYPTDSPHLDKTYENFARYIEEVILQAAHIHPVPWEQALLALLERIEPQDINWWLAGSATLSARGLDVVPGDVDLITDDTGAHKLAEVLLDYLVQPVQNTRDWICNWYCTAFLHTSVGWVGGVHKDIDEPEVSDFGPTAESRLETITWREHKLRVPPLDLQLEVSKRRGLTDRAEQIENYLESHGRHS